jgi:signal transduction histidine kinase/ActR/RegA family two-component response regulator
MKILPRAGTAGMLCSHILTLALGVHVRADGTDRMKSFTEEPGAGTKGLPSHARSGRLFRKYATIFVAAVCLALVTNGAFDMWFSYQEQKALLVQIQRGQAEFAASRISQFVEEIEDQMAWVTPLPWNAVTLEEWRFDAVRLLRQVPAVTEVAQLDAAGREKFRISRHAMDITESHVDYSRDPIFVQAMANKIYFGPVYFVDGSEPYMAIAVAGIGRDHGVIVCQVNLKFIWEVVSQIKSGTRGFAYVVDSSGRLIADPDISLVLRNTDMSGLPQVRVARALEAGGDESFAAVDRQGKPVLSAHATVAPLNWLVFVEMPIDEAYSPLYNSIMRSAVLLLVALALAFLASLLFARRMVVPIRALQEGTMRIGRGDLTQRIAIKTNDELEALGDEFNKMAARLQESYATLEHKVEERTRQLELANLAKSRFLAAASHDLRQPLHALGLFVAQLHGRLRANDRRRIVSRIDAALSAMNELFNALLDISKLDAGVLTPSITEFPVVKLLDRVETTFTGAAREKGLSLRIITSSAWVRSDFILLERIVFNLVSNAIRYTSSGRVVVGCRKRGLNLRVEVWDTGPGVPQDQQQNIFGEFYRLGTPGGDGRSGLGLGLAIVDRLCRLLDHVVSLTSTVGKGSCFSVAVPRVAARPEIAESPSVAHPLMDGSDRKLVVVIDDDPLVLEGMCGLFRSWGYHLLVAGTDDEALAGVADRDRPPDLIVSDYHLSGGKTGIEAIEGLRRTLSAEIPAFLVSGDTNPELLRQARAGGYHLLHKPVDPMTLRAMVSYVLREQQVARAH